MIVKLFHHSSELWPLNHKVTFDGVNKYIIVNPDVTSLDIRSDVYTAWVQWLSTPNGDNAPFFFAMRYAGLDIIPGGFTGDIFFLINGWKLLIDLSKVAVSGVLFSDNYDTAFYTPSVTSQYPAKVAALVNTVSTIQNIITGTPQTIWEYSTRTTTDAAAQATAVRTELSAELAKINAQVDGLTVNQETMLLEIYALYGLDPTKPLIVSETQRSAGAGITQTIVTTPTETTVTRT